MVYARLCRLLVIVAPAAVLACQPRPSAGPAPIAYGEDVCAACDHVISDRRFAAQYIMPGGVVKKFDDPGCLFRILRNEPGQPSAVYFQHFPGERWLSSKEVWFAATQGAKSPQGYGWAAYASFAEAQDVVTGTGGGQILPFEPAKERIARRVPTPEPAEPARAGR
jgi:hypothetical protein